MRVGSLFSGIGGLELGFERAGMQTVWQVEQDPYALAVLKKHWPNVRRHTDVRTFPPEGDWSCDLICGGFPCQPFSSASRGRKRGVSDDRWLWPQMRRVISILKPTWVVGENVAQFDGLGLEEMVSDLEALGYEVSPPLEIPACAVGFDHRRSRLYVLGYSDSNGKSSRTVDAEVAVLPRRGGKPGGVRAQDGVPSRVDRLRCLGNAVVPQVAEAIGRMIMSPSPSEGEK